MKQTIIIATANVTNRTESMNRYWSDVNKCETLSQDTIDELAARYQLTGNTECLNAIVKANLKFVISCAKQRQHLGLPLDDLVQEGNIGLLEAAKNYDPTRGVKFSSCAVQYIRKYINEALSDKGRMVRVPQNLLRGGYNSFADSMDAPLKGGDDENKTYGETFASDTKANDFDDTNDNALKVRYLLNKLGNDEKGKRKQKIVCLLWGIGTRPHTQYEIARMLGMCEERVRQINLECLQIMRKFA